MWDVPLTEPSSPMTSKFLPLVLLGWCPTAVAVAQAPIDFAKLAIEMPNDGAVVPGSYVRTMAARIGGDADLDLVALVDHGGSFDAVYLPDPLKFRSYVPFAAGVQDVALMPPDGTGRQPILVLKAGQLERYEWSANSQVPERVASDPNWSGCGRIWIAAYDQEVYLYAMYQHGKLIRAKFDGTEFQQDLVLDAPDVTDIQTMHWNDDTEPELIVRCDSQVWVASLAIEPIFYFQFPSSTGPGENLLTVVPGSGANPDLLAAYGYMPANPYGVPVGQYLLQLRDAYLGLQPCGIVKGRSIAAGDANHDGLVDVVVGDLEGSILHVATRKPGSTVLGLSSFLPMVDTPLVTGSLRPSGAVDTLVAADFDRDGDADLFGTQNAARLFHVVRNAAVSALPPFVGVDYLNRVDHPGQGGSPGTVDVPVEVDLPAAWQSLTYPGETLHLQFYAWFRGDSAEFSESTPRVADVMVPATSSLVQATLTFGRDDLMNETWVMWLHTRLVAVDAQGARRYLDSQLLFFSPDPALMAARTMQVTIDRLGESVHLGAGDGSVGSIEEETEIGLPPRH